MIQHLFVHGRVQGVGFRYSAQREAERLGLKGWIRNRSCGRRVELVIDGSDEAVTSYLEWCGHGPAHANVDQVELLDDAPDPGSSPSFKVQPTH